MHAKSRFLMVVSMLEVDGFAAGDGSILLGILPGCRKEEKEQYSTSRMKENKVRR